MPKVLLEPLKKYPVELTGITSMVDSGGAAGQIRERFGVLPARDIRRHVLALSNAPNGKKSFGNFVLAMSHLASGIRDMFCPMRLSLVWN